MNINFSGDSYANKPTIYFRTELFMLSLFSLQVADDFIGLDVLSSFPDVKVANFRKVPGINVYGMAQPCREVG